MPTRPRLLFLSQCLPYPPDSGVKIRGFNVLKQLRQAFDVTLLMFSRRNHQPDASSLAIGRDALSELGLDVYEPVRIGSEESSVRAAWDHLCSVATHRPFTFYQYRSDRFRGQLHDAVQRGGISLVHLDSIDLHGIVDDLPAVPIVCTHPDIESHALHRRADREPSALRRHYIRHQARLVGDAERALCPAFAANLVVSDVDADRLRALAPDAEVVVAPNGVDTGFFSPPPERRGSAPSARVVFVGPTFFEPNREGVEFFLSSVWPLVRGGNPTASLHLIGRGSGDDQARFSTHPGVAVYGYVPDVRPHLGAADCVVVPIRFGGGTRLKILDAWAMGRAVVSTSLGCEGLRAVDGVNIMVRDDPAEFAQAVSEVLADPHLRSRLGERGRCTVEQSYGWDAIGDGIRQLYLRLAQ